MAGIQALTTTPTALLDLDPYRFPAMLTDDWHEETSTAHGTMEFGDCPLPTACACAFEPPVHPSGAGRPTAAGWTCTRPSPRQVSRPCRATSTPSRPCARSTTPPTSPSGGGSTGLATPDTSQESAG